MTQRYETHYKFAAAESRTSARFNAIFEDIDNRLNAAEVHILRTDNPHGVTVGDAAQVAIQLPVGFSIPGDDDPDTHVHFRVQISENADFSDPVVDAESKDDQTAWYYNNGSTWTALQVAGVLAYWEWESDDFGQRTKAAQGYTGYEAMYVVPSDAGLTSGKTYYYRIMQYDVEGAEYGSEWIAGAVKT